MQIISPSSSLVLSSVSWGFHLGLSSVTINRYLKIFGFIKIVVASKFRSRRFRANVIVLFKKQQLRTTFLLALLFLGHGPHCCGPKWYLVLQPFHRYSRKRELQWYFFKGSMKWPEEISPTSYCLTSYNHMKLKGSLWNSLYSKQACCCSPCCGCLVAKSCPTLLWPHVLWPTRLLCAWDFPGKNTGVVCHFLLQGIFPTQRLNPSPAALALTGRLFTTEGSPWPSGGGSKKKTIPLYSPVTQGSRGRPFYLPKGALFLAHCL